jgi:hypothetical protein
VLKYERVRAIAKLAVVIEGSQKLDDIGIGVI